MGNRGSSTRRQAQQQDAQASAPRAAPLGEWLSPVTSSFITEKVRPPGGSATDVTPPAASGFNVRTTVHEYGGGEYCIAGDTLYFTNFKDQALYAQELGGGAPSQPRLVTPGSEARGERFADARWDAGRRRLVAISELHRDEAGAELPPERVVNRLVAVDVASGAVTPLASGSDFYAAPRVSPCGRWLAFVTWDFPNMPWDCTSLQVAPLLDDGTAGPPVRQVAGAGRGLAGGSSAVQQPAWSADGRQLHYLDDASGWWNLYRRAAPPPGAAGEAAAWAAPGAAEAEALCPMAAEWGFPMWSLGLCSYQVLSDGRVLALFGDPSAAGSSLALLSPPAPEGGHAAGSWTLSRINAGLTSFGTPALALQQLPDGGVTLAAVGASPSRASAVVHLTVPSVAALASSTPSDWVAVRTSSTSQIPEGYLSTPEAVSYPTTFDGQPATAYMLYYPPTNKDFTFPPGTLPPLLVKSHGGPTSAASAALNPLVQYWTSRGYAYADIDYGGSTGYGRAYRDRLKGRWGVVDVQDCCAAAEWLVAAGRVDPQRLCISGGSAGGYTTLACLAFRKTFSAGASLYGVADLKLLAEHTHKFESKYLDQLVGPLPEAAELYDARSPLSHAKQFSAPAAFFQARRGAANGARASARRALAGPAGRQGDQDKVVPPEQAVVMHAALKAAGIPTALVMLAGEQHGFRQAASIRTALDGELYFYGATLGFPASMPEDLPKIPIDNLPPAGTA
ncbi:Dipeptidyl peptidase family member 6 [Tetrabaena socialis]|uniref:Dipeptidyl peptidase family member 6 n=1 Tax=Tetrabaena socialis TaxID=47790 RepID=A0A2J8A7F1_9CHLO|nr:Dipeptidyl peptidase family member 6 [Tetrabaena socialis]|eukprot:PNH08437.1 Dipeptidyl peptidase family member 6 [Tetrabaena socialis]